MERDNHERQQRRAMKGNWLMTGMCCSNGQGTAVGTGMMNWARYGQWKARQDGKVGKLMQGRVEGKVEKGD